VDRGASSGAPTPRAATLHCRRPTRNRHAPHSSVHPPIRIIAHFFGRRFTPFPRQSLAVPRLPPFRLRARQRSKWPSLTPSLSSFVDAASQPLHERVVRAPCPLLPQSCAGARTSAQRCQRTPRKRRKIFWNHGIRRCAFVRQARQHPRQFATDASAQAGGSGAGQAPDTREMPRLYLPHLAPRPLPLITACARCRWLLAACPCPERLLLLPFLPRVFTIAA
jgi:hypothetical protein